MLPTLKILWETTDSTRIETSFKEKQERFGACEEKIHTHLGLDFANELLNAWDDLHMAELDRAFEQGFLAAWRLWAEVSAASNGV